MEPYVVINLTKAGYTVWILFAGFLLGIVWLDGMRKARAHTDAAFAKRMAAQYTRWATKAEQYEARHRGAL